MTKREVLHKYFPALLLTGALAAYVAIVIRTAWLSDDAYITLRTVDNFVSGYGLRWNILERVQSYTHPLWMLMVATVYFFTKEAFYTLTWLSIAVSTAAAAVLAFGVAKRTSGALLGIALLIFSKAFIDYSTSGLETPLIFLMLGIFIAIWMRWSDKSLKQTLPLTLTASLLGVTRLDTLAIVLPALLYAWWMTVRSHPWHQTLAAIVAGLTPLILWESFSLAYYGFLFPNTAYAKLFGTKLSPEVLLDQGAYYFVHTWINDPLTLASIAAALAYSFYTRSFRYISLSLGIIFYLFYTWKIGGDFMAGRFFAPLLFVAACLWSRARLPRLALAGAFGLVMLGFLATPAPSVTADDTYDVQANYGYDKTRGVADERAYYYQRSGLLSKNISMPQRGWVGSEAAFAEPLRVLPRESNGRVAFQAGPRVHVIDQLALSDPLLARLPGDPGRGWRVGHVERRIPTGYAESVTASANSICDTGVRQLYDHIRRITRDPVFSLDRLYSIWLINTGQLGFLVAEYTPQDDCVAPAR